jgi:hypothetical protein
LVRLLFHSASGWLNLHPRRRALALVELTKSTRSARLWIVNIVENFGHGDASSL